MTEESTPETGSETPAPEPTAAPSLEDLQAEVDKWKALSRKNEDKARANAQAQSELERLRQESMTEQERAVEQARQEARQQTLAEVGTLRVSDAFRVASAGKSIDIDALIEGVNLAGFLGDDGQPDIDKVEGWVERIAPKIDQPTTPTVPDLGQGARPTPPGLGSSQLQKDLMAKLGAR